MQRRDFLKTSVLAGSAYVFSWQAVPAPAPAKNAFPASALPVSRSLSE